MIRIPLAPPYGAVYRTIDFAVLLPVNIFGVRAFKPLRHLAFVSLFFSIPNGLGPGVPVLSGGP
jgi:hypothetical protein